MARMLDLRHVFELAPPSLINENVDLDTVYPKSEPRFFIHCARCQKGFTVQVTPPQKAKVEGGITRPPHSLRSEGLVCLNYFPSNHIYRSMGMEMGV